MRPRRPLLVLAALLLLAAPFLPGFPPFWTTLLAYVGLYTLVTLGIVVLTGIGRMTSFGQAMFVGIGAYASAILCLRLGWSPWATLPASLAITTLVAALIGIVTLRLSGHYLPLATMAWNIAFFYLAGNLDLTGRYEGLSGIPPIRLFSLPLTDGRAVHLLVWLVVLLAFWLTGNLLESRPGRTIRALGGGRIAAESVGIDTARAKLLAFVYAACLAGLSGWLYAHTQRALNPTPFGLNASIEYLLMAVVGGVGHPAGALLGAGLVTLVRDKLQDILPVLIGQQGNFESIVFGIVLVGLLQGARDGLWPALARLGRRIRPAAPASVPVPAAPIRSAPAGLRPSSRRGDATGPLLESRDLRKSFGGLAAVDGLDLAIRPGEIVGMIGPNGAGKSTSFDLLTGVTAPSGGVIRVGGRDVTGRPSRAIAREGVARTFQHVRLVPGLSVLDNVVIGAHLRGRVGPLRALLRLGRGEERALFAEARRQIDRVGLGDAADAKAGSLALGRQRIVEIARALCLGPDLLLLDEPAAGLRHFEKAALATLLSGLRAEGLGVLVVEHDMDFLLGLADRLVVLDFGKPIAEGDAASIRRNPAVIEAYLGAVPT